MFPVRVQGEMCVSPQCFHVLTHMLMGLAEGRLVLALEVKQDTKYNNMCLKMSWIVTSTGFY